MSERNQIKERKCQCGEVIVGKAYQLKKHAIEKGCNNGNSRRSNEPREEAEVIGLGSAQR